MLRHLCVPALIVGMAALCRPVAIAHSQEPRYGSPTGSDASQFRVDSAADYSLRTLWDASTAAGAERAACIGGERRDGIAYITRVLPLDPALADSLGVSASTSIDRCGPPTWFGTAHTHIALYDGQHPYPAFSGADRGVMMLWWRRWQVDAVFCVLYSRSAAHCETLGTGGGLVAGPGTRTSY